MEPDDLTQHCFRCKGLAVVDRRSLDHLPGLLYKAANMLDEQPRYDVYDGADQLIVDLKAAAMLLDMMPND